MARRFVLGCSLLVLGVLLGCSGSKSRFKDAVSVSGTVNLDGQPMPDGTITFIGEGGATEQVPVKDGKFQGGVTPGKKRVEIRAFKLGKPTKMGDQVIEATPENYIPATYNTDSKITAEVAGGAINPSTFEVKSK